MTDTPSQVRKKAERLRKLAQMMPYSDDTELLREAAGKYERDADALEAEPQPAHMHTAYMYGQVP